MFTGLIQTCGRIATLEDVQQGGRLTIEAPHWERPIEQGESVAVEGVCLTMIGNDDGQIMFDVLRETLDRTNLGRLRPGDSVNLERALRYGDAMSGQLVQGHVDGTGKVVEVGERGRDHLVTISCSEALLEDMVYKGSVAVNGASLTITRVENLLFEVHIIPHTWDQTTFQYFLPGTVVNIETDIMAKYLRRLAASGKLESIPDWKSLFSDSSD